MFENALEQTWSRIINNKYEVYFQPQYNLYTDEIIGLEALARLNDANGLVSPSSFISVLETNRLIGELDCLVYESVCKFIKKCQDRKSKVLPISVNLSHIDFESETFLDDFEGIRKKYGIDPSLVKIELTEALSRKDKHAALIVIDKLHDFGYKVKLDNYRGTDPGLTLATEMCYDEIKLNMGFYNQDIVENNGTEVASVIDKAFHRRLEVSAEYVETKEQVEFLKSMDCEIAQGYFYMKPMSERFIFNQINKAD